MPMERFSQTAPTTIEVVGGIAYREGRILLAQRPAGKAFPFTWECPGGKVEADESHHEALRREWIEELGVGVGPLPHTAQWSGRFATAGCPSDREEIYMLFYAIADRFVGTPCPREGQGVGWFTEAEMRGLALAPGNLRALEDICRVAFGSRPL